MISIVSINEVQDLFSVRFAGESDSRSHDRNGIHGQYEAMVVIVSSVKPVHVINQYVHICPFDQSVKFEIFDLFIAIGSKPISPSGN